MRSGARCGGPGIDGARVTQTAAAICAVGHAGHRGGVLAQAPKAVAAPLASKRPCVRRPTVRAAGPWHHAQAHRTLHRPDPHRAWADRPHKVRAERNGT